MLLAMAALLAAEPAAAAPVSPSFGPVRQAGVTNMVQDIADRKVVRKRSVGRTVSRPRSVARPKAGMSRHVARPNRVIKHRSTARRNVIVHRSARPYRPWSRRAYYGTLLGGVALGTILVVAANAAPAPPADNMCWYWANRSHTRGYWDYCVAP